MTKKITYLASPNTTLNQVQHIAAKLNVIDYFPITRRGVALGWIGRTGYPEAHRQPRNRWLDASPILISKIANSLIPHYEEDINTAQRLVNAILNDEDGEELLNQSPYKNRLHPRFDLLTTVHDEGDDQEIVTLEFDVYNNGELISENIWMKISWLSFEESDASLRFRFSFGMANYEDVAADYSRQKHAAELTDAVFPESVIITKNETLLSKLRSIMQIDDVAFVERIIYFNAPNGGAQFHHDVERGHLGVIYTQVSGRTAWIALSKQALIREIQHFTLNTPVEDSLLKAGVNQAQVTRLRSLAADAFELENELDEGNNNALENLLNRTPEFISHLVEKDYMYILDPGDALLLPQHDTQHCAWHTVFCLGDSQGEGLSFAMRSLANSSKMLK